MTVYSIASEIVTLPLVPPVKQAQLRAQPQERKSRQLAKRDTVTISSEALQLARDGAATEDE